MLFARILGALGRTLIWAGTIILLFVVYQLWGTNLAHARAQDDLAGEFEERLAQVTTTTTAPPADGPDPTSTTTTRPEPVPPPVDGEAVAHIVIPSIGVDQFVVEGVSRSDLKKGPGHYPGTPLPGQPGNASIAGHRTTYGAPFNRVDELDPGDEILVTTVQGSFRYEVEGQEIVRPTDVHVVEDKGDDRLTLTSCHPEYSARQRIVITAVLVDEPAPAPPPVETGDDPVTELPDEEPGTDQGNDETELTVLDGDERGPIGPAIAWGALALGVWIAVYALSRRWRRWPAYVLGTPVFGVALFVFFEAVAETLPANF